MCINCSARALIAECTTSAGVHRYWSFRLLCMPRPGKGLVMFNFYLATDLQTGWSAIGRRVTRVRSQMSDFDSVN